MENKKIPSAIIALFLYTSFILILILSLKYFTLLAAPIFFSSVVAYLLSPVAGFLERKTKLSRVVISAMLMILLVFVFLFLIITIFPYVVDQVTSAAQKIPQIMEKFSEKIQVFNDYITNKFPDYIGNIDVMAKIKEILESLLTNLSHILIGAFSSLYGFLVTLIYIILIPLFSYYFIRDFRKIKNSLIGLVPLSLRDKVLQKMEKMDDILSSFIRGQAIVVLILAVLYSVGLSIVGLPFAMLIGIFAGIGDIIPYFGTIVGLIISLIVAFVSFQSIEKILLVIIVFIIVKGSENWFFYPKIVGREVGLHFVWVLFSIILFGQLFGFWGLVVAIPSAAGFKVFITDLIRYYKRSGFYTKK